MNYEQILDEIMVNTLSAEKLIWYPQKDFHYAVCPWTLEFHTTIFLSSILLSLNQEKPLVILIQSEELPENAMVYTWAIGPHFWRIRECWKTVPQELLENGIATTDKNYYPYLDKLFCYLSVINVNENHLVLFIKKGAKNSAVSDALKKLLWKDYALLVISNCHQWLPSDTCKERSENLINNLKNKTMDEEEKEAFPALSVLSELLPNKENPNHIEQLINSWEIGFDTKESTSLWFMMS